MTPSMSWGRVIYRSGKQYGDRKNALGNTPEYNYDLTAFQVGTDLYSKVRTDGSHEQAGISLSAGTIDAGASHYTRRAAGEDTLRAYGVGAYWTHFGPSCWYLDGVLQVNRFDIEAKPNELAKLKTRGWGYTASLENGYPFEVDKDWYVEPQLQAIYSYVDLDSSDDVGAKIRFKDVYSVSADSACASPRTGALTAWTKANDAPMAGCVPAFCMNSRANPRPSSPRPTVSCPLKRISVAVGGKRTWASIIRLTKKSRSTSQLATRSLSIVTVTATRACWASNTISDTTAVANTQVDRR